MEIDLFGNIIQQEKDYNTETSSDSPFVYMNNISKKDYPDSLEGYNPFLTNLGFSQRQDTVLYANEMNKYADLPIEAQFDFYFYSLPKKNYFAKWAKKMKREETEMIMEYFKVSYKVAKQYEKILEEKQLQQIKKWYETRKGGK
tara:strand:+ start:2911 stop:3342 length:432 start_codon:yes stop_codon:yes gene_type:complete